MRRNVKNTALFASALLIVAPAAISAQETAEPTPYEENIAAAKSQMMGNSAAALEAALKAETLASADGDDGALNRLNAMWLQGEALMRLNRAPEAEKIIGDALVEVAIKSARCQAARGSFALGSGNSGFTKSITAKRFPAFRKHMTVTKLWVRPAVRRLSCKIWVRCIPMREITSVF